jgi:hypothetical protein
MLKRFLLTLILTGVTALVLSGCGGTFSNETVDTEVSRCITTLVWAVSKEHGHGSDTRGKNTPQGQAGDIYTSIRGYKIKGIDNLIDAHCSQYLDEELITAFESGLIDANPTLTPQSPASAVATPDFTGGLVE